MANNQIALLAQMPVFDTPFESQGKALKIRDMMRQNETQDMDMQVRRDSIQRAAGLRSTLAGFKPDAKPDEQVDALTRAGYLTEARTLAESSSKVNKDKREGEKFQLEAMAQKLKLAGQIMGGVKDQASWTRARQQSIQAFGQDAAAEMPEQYDPSLVEQNRQQASTMSEQLEQYWKKKGYDLDVQKAGETVRHNKSQEGLTRRGQNMADERARDQNENGRGVIIQTDSGPMLANSRTGTTRQIIGPDGKPVTRTKPLTEFQGKSAAFGDRAMAADALLGKIGEDYSPAGINAKMAAEDMPLIGGMMGAAGNAMLSGNSQQVEQAQRDFINAVLRQESGAAIGASEFQNAKKQYFPQPNDGPKVLAQKAANRKLVIEGFKRSAGANADFTPAGNNAPALPDGWSVETQ